MIMAEQQQITALMADTHKLQLSARDSEAAVREQAKRNGKLREQNSSLLKFVRVSASFSVEPFSAAGMDASVARYLTASVDSAAFLSAINNSEHQQAWANFLEAAATVSKSSGKLMIKKEK